MNAATDAQSAAASSGVPEDNQKRNRVLTLIAAIFIGLGLIWLLLYVFIFSRRETTDDAYVGGNQITVSSRVEGTVIEVLADETQPVKAGQILVRLDPADAEIELMRAAGNLAATVRQTQQQEQQAAQADAALAQQHAEFERADADYRRRAPLLAAKAAAPEDIEHARQALEAARSALEQAKRQANAAHTLVDGTTTQTAPAVIQARAQYADAWIRNARNTIIAPIDGVAVRRQVQPGQHVQPGQSLLTIVPLNHLWVDANFKENQLMKIRIGQEARIEPTLYGGDIIFHGRVVGISPGTGAVFSLLPPQNASGNWIKIVQRITVRIALDPEELHSNPLRIGLSTDATVYTHRNADEEAAWKAQQRIAPIKVYDGETESANEAADAIVAANIVTPQSDNIQRR